AFLREQMREFFGLSETDVPQGLAEDAMFSLYRKQLRQKCGVPFAADLVIPHATYDRTWFRLVMGGHHRTAVELFRDVERRICGAEAGGVRDEARHRGATQLGLDLQMNQPDLTYARLHAADLQLAPGDVLKMLTQKSPQAFEELWPQVLSERHITRVELGRELWNLYKQKGLVIQNLEGRQRTTKDKNLLALPEQS
ncbi:MAG TPA: hypothetical protein VEU33_44890, partial [Archangium sp.]|nr:hypothetical protein [Archangium sp.]